MPKITFKQPIKAYLYCSEDNRNPATWKAAIDLWPRQLRLVIPKSQIHSSADVANHIISVETASINHTRIVYEVKTLTEVGVRTYELEPSGKGNMSGEQYSVTLCDD
jgi:hypothetical protein